jgi:simple sugar transport system permease protein
VAYGKLQPFIVTLAMMTAALGAGRLISGRGGAVHPIYESGPQAVHASFWVLREFLGGILPMPGLIFLICTGGAYVILTQTRFGRHVYAVGGNAETARLSGISVARTQLVVYALSGLLSGLTGVLYAAQYRQGKPDAGSGAELDAIAAVVVGGTRLMGGRGSVLGTFAGVLMLGILNNVLSLRSVDTNIQLILKGIIIMGAVLLQEGKSPVGFLRSLISAVRNKAL